MMNLPDWLYVNTWIVPLMITASGVMTALGAALTYRNQRSRWGLGLLIASALIQAFAGCVWYGQPALWGRSVHG